MWHDNPVNVFFCPKCNGILKYEFHSFDPIKCKNCYKFKRLLKCSNAFCKFQKMLCQVCDEEEFVQLRDSVELSEKFKTLNYSSVDDGCSKVCSGTSEDENISGIKMLRKHYHSQKNETWYHFMSVLEKKNPTVKTITLLYEENRRTSDCLAKELIFLYTKNRNIKIDEITFSHFGYENQDYGIVLEHYRPIIKKFKIFFTDLNEVSGNIARIFHTLCDEISSDTKPSLFIFTLKYEKGLKNLKPVERATTVLKKLWYYLPENEISPLLCRVIKNVVEILPEEQVLC